MEEVYKFLDKLSRNFDNVLSVTLQKREKPARSGLSYFFSKWREITGLGLFITRWFYDQMSESLTRPPYAPHFCKA